MRFSSGNFKQIFLVLPLWVLAFGFLPAASADIVVTETDGITEVSEGVSFDYFSVALSSSPTSLVEVRLVPTTMDIELNGDYPGDSIILEFNSSNWSVAQDVSVRAVQDSIEEGSHSCQIDISASSEDLTYSNLTASPVNVYITDYEGNPCSEADIDGDCTVSMSDLELMAAQWLGSPCSGPDCADLVNADGVDMLDFQILSTNWNEVFGPVVISEFMAKNSSNDPGVDQESWEVFDENNEACDWIEIYNVSTEPVSLAGWYLTDDADDLAKWSFPEDMNIASGEYLLVYASGNDTSDNGYVHTNFSLSASGEYLAIVDPSGRVAQAYTTVDNGYPEQLENISYGLAGYFTEQRYFSPATPGSANVGSVISIVSDTHFSVKRGFYTDPFYVEITADEVDTQIRYTTDGSAPTVSHGTLYDPSSPIYVDKTTTLRATAYKTGWLPSNVDTQTYIFVSDVLTQSPNGEVPEGWPASYEANGHIMDYGMDPDIVNNLAYASYMETALLSIPTLSVVTDLDNLFNDENGVYVHVDDDTRINGEYYEQPISLELINPDGTKGFQVDCGARIRGAYSRQLSNPKHSLHLYFRSKYGDPKLEYPLFGDEGTDEFDKIDLRTNANFAWHGNWLPHLISVFSTCVHDEYCRLVQGMLGHPYTRTCYYHLYLNGQYWGLYETQERVDYRFAASYLPGSKDDYDVMKVDALTRSVVATDGDLNTYRELYDAVIDGIDPLEYYSLQGINSDGTRNPDYKRLLDVDNLIDFMLLTYYVANTDGPGSRWTRTNNFYAIINRNDPDGFKWLAHDNEHTLGVCEADDSRRENMVTPLTTAGANFSYFNPQWLHEQLANQVPEYRLRFADRAHELLYNGGIFTGDKTYEIMDSLAKQINTAMIAESARWGDVIGEFANNPYTWQTWNEAMQFTYNWIYGTRTELSNGTLNYYQNWPMYPREDRVIGQFRSINWYPSFDAPEFSQHGGNVESNYSLSISNPDGVGTIYYTTDGADPRHLSSEVQGVSLFTEDSLKYVCVPTEQLSMAGVKAETFLGIGGFLLDYLYASENYPDNPSYVELWDKISMPTVDHDNTYATRTRALLHPPVSGEYTFWLICDDNGSLKLSTDSTPENASEIAYIYGDNTWGDPGNWYKFAFQQSEPIYLEAGQAYYIEALQKENSGGDHLLVGWSGPDIAGPVVIDSQYFTLPPDDTLWAQPYFDTADWTVGYGPVAYENSPNNEINYTSYVTAGIDVKSEMFGKLTSCYIRIPFTYSASQVSSLILNMRYDDGCIVYLNGVEVYRDNLDGTEPIWSSQAFDFRDDAFAVVMKAIDISEYVDLLRVGDNVLAIHGLNDQPTSSDFLISAELTAYATGNSEPSPTSVEYTGPVTLDKSQEVKARIFTGSQWSALTSADFSVGPVADSLRVTELMYHPADPNYEFIELQNIGTEPINLNKVELTKGVNHLFGDVTLPAGEFVVLVPDKAMFEAYYTDLSPSCIVEQWDSGTLDNNSEMVRVKDATGNIIQEFEYKDWYSQTDGDGFSLVILNAYDNVLTNWNLKDSWTVSTSPDGTPGEYEQVLAANSIVINEILAHSHNDLPDWVELYNTTDRNINIGGWYLSDSAENLQKYQIPSVTIPAYGYAVFSEDTDFGEFFRLSENGEKLYLSSAVGGILTGYQESEDFGASNTGVPFGRYQKSDGSYNFVSMSEPTPGAANAYPLVGPLVITEIMYNPMEDGDAEYIEIQNTSDYAVNLWYDDNVNSEQIPWRLIDEDGILIEFPIGVTLLAGEKLLVVKDQEDFETVFGTVPDGVQYYQWTSGKLSNGGEKIELQMPGDTDGIERFFIRVDRVNYDDEDGWPLTPDAQGDSLHRIALDDYGNDYINWSAAAPSPGI